MEVQAGWTLNGLLHFRVFWGLLACHRARGGRIACWKRPHQKPVLLLMGCVTFNKLLACSGPWLVPKMQSKEK